MAIPPGSLSWINGPIIRAGESLSEPVDLTGGDLLRLTMPKTWSDAEVTFQISTDGVEYNDLYDRDGREISIPVTPGAAILLSGDLMRGIGFLKIRSGTSSNEKPQPEQRNFALTIAVVTATEEPAREAKPAVDQRSGAKRYRRPVPRKKPKGRRR